MKKFLVFIVLLSCIAIWPFFNKGYFETHDGEWMIIRFTAFHQTLTAGQFPVRFVDRLNSNYGYPVANFLYPLPFYLAEVPKILGLSFVDSIKVIFALSVPLSALAMFWALSQKFGKYAAFAGAIVYIFIPYRFVDLYVRGSLGESIAFVFLPLILGAIFKLQKGSKIFLPILSVFISFLILSHNVIAALFLPLALALGLIGKTKLKLPIIASFVLGVLIASFFIFPALGDLRYVQLSQIKVSEIADHLVPPTSLIIPSWGYGPSPIGQNHLPVQFGIVTLTLFLAALIIKFSSKIKNKEIDLLSVTFVAAFFLLTNSSQALWQNIPLVDVIQFPWRLLSLVVFASAIFAAFVVENGKKNVKKIAIIIVAASIISTIAYTKPQQFVDKPDGFYATNEATTTVRDEYLPLWVKEKPLHRADQKIVIEGQGIVISSTIKPTNYQAVIEASESLKVTVNTIYFPGWEVHDNKQNVQISHDNKNGLMTFELPKGNHEVIIKFTGSGYHLASEMASAISLLIVGGLTFSLWRRKNS